MSRRIRPLRTPLPLLLALVLLALPAVRGVGDAPETAPATLSVEDWRPAPAGWQQASIDLERPAMLAADLSDHTTVEVRSRDGEGWTDWQRMHAAGEHVPDEGSREWSDADPTLSEPVWLGDIEALEVRTRAGTTAPLRLETVDVSGGDGTAWEPPSPGALGSAEALSVWPPMVPRSSWDPEGECTPRAEPEYAPAVERVYVHHTAIFPEYEPHETDDLVRAMCVFHVEQRRFDDLGYNFLIDRYGRIYQGREGGILRGVVGAHASGFNHGSAGIALIGNFNDEPPPPKALAALDELMAWLFEWHDIAPYDVGVHVSTGGATTPHDEGEHVELPSIVGHRQTATNTDCPGELLWVHIAGPDRAVDRVAALLRDRGVDVGPSVPLPVEPRVVPREEAARVAPATVPRVFERVVHAVRSLADRRLDQRLLPALGSRTR